MLEIDPRAVYFLILKARVFDDKDPPGETDLDAGPGQERDRLALRTRRMADGVDLHVPGRRVPRPHAKRPGESLASSTPRSARAGGSVRPVASAAAIRPMEGAVWMP